MADDPQRRVRRGRVPFGASPGRRSSPILTRRRARELAEKEAAAANATNALTTMTTKTSVRANPANAAVTLAVPAARSPAAAVDEQEMPGPPPTDAVLPVAMGKEAKEGNEQGEPETAVAPAASPAPAPPAPTAREIAAAEAARQRLYGNAEAAPTSTIVLPSGTPPPVVVDVPLRATCELEPLCQGSRGESSSGNENVSSLLASAVSSLGPERRWDDVARGLDTLRRGIKHHKVEALAVLPSALPGIAAAVGSLRSALCRAALAAAADVAAAFGADEPWVVVGKESCADDREENGGEKEGQRGLLACLLSKAASNDKKFIVDAAASALSAATAKVPAEILAPRLLDLLAAKPPLAPRGRATAARALAEVVARSSSPSSSSSWIADDQSLLFDKLSDAASELSRDAWPPARQAARDLAAALAKKEERRGVAQPPASFAAAPASAPPSEQGKENETAPASVTPFSAAGKAMNVVGAPAAAPPPRQLLIPERTTLGERGE